MNFSKKKQNDPQKAEWGIRTILPFGKGRCAANCPQIPHKNPKKNSAGAWGHGGMGTWEHGNMTSMEHNSCHSASAHNNHPLPYALPLPSLTEGKGRINTSVDNGAAVPGACPRIFENNVI